MPYMGKQKHDDLRALITGYVKNGSGLAKVLGRSEHYGISRLEDPGKLTIQELETIRRKAHIPVDELGEKVRRVI